MSYEHGFICPPSNFPHQQSSITLQDLWITQSDIDGMLALIHWLQGYNEGTKGGGTLPGYFEFVMFVRRLCSAANKQIQTERSEENLEKEQS